jgi:hypothetical protein
VQPTAADVSAGVRSTLPDYPNIARYVTAGAILRSAITHDMPPNPDAISRAYAEFAPAAAASTSPAAISHARVHQTVAR